MATFPDLEPIERSYDFGRYPITQAGSSQPVRFRHGTVPSWHALTLAFQAITAAEAGQIRTHYRLQQGGYIPFALSVAAWRGHTSQTDLVPSTTLWRYDGPPEEAHRSGALVDVTVRLRSCIL